MGRLAEERRVVDRAQIDQKLDSPARRINLENMLMKLRETLKPLEL